MEGFILAEAIKQEMDLDLEEEFVQDENCNLVRWSKERSRSSIFERIS